MDVKNVKAGEFIGYGTSFLAQQDMKVATVPVGYFHGFSRSLSNRGRVLIKGERINVVGMVNMNALIVDVTLIDGVNKGDEVVLIGKQGDLEISVSAFGEMSVQLNYELLTRLPADIPRNIVN
jgi:alanine racemase